MPRGIYPGSPKTGRIESSFFSKVAYISIGKTKDFGMQGTE